MKTKIYKSKKTTHSKYDPSEYEIIDIEDDIFKHRLIKYSLYNDCKSAAVGYVVEFPLLKWAEDVKDDLEFKNIIINTLQKQVDGYNKILKEYFKFADNKGDSGVITKTFFQVELDAINNKRDELFGKEWRK